MLTGALLGAIIVLLILRILFVQGQNAVYAGQVLKLAKEQGNTDKALATASAALQEMQKPIIFNLTDEHVTKLAERVAVRVQLILDSTQESALKRMH